MQGRAATAPWLPLLLLTRTAAAGSQLDCESCRGIAAAREQLEWRLECAGCSHNGSEVMRASEAVALERCKALCESHSLCAAVEFDPASGSCVLRGTGSAQPLNSSAPTQSVYAINRGGQDPYNLTALTCQQLSDIYGITHNEHWGCSSLEAANRWLELGCDTRPAECSGASCPACDGLCSEVPGLFDYPVLRCERGAMLCASREGDSCYCTGTMYFGRKFAYGGPPGSGERTSLAMLRTFEHRSKKVDGVEACVVDSFAGGDPAPGYYKQCFCEGRRVLACDCAVKVELPSKIPFVKTAAVSGNLRVATMECSKSITVSGDVDGTEFDFRVDNAEREVELAKLVCPVVLRFDNLTFSEDGAHFCPALGFGACGSGPQLDCIALHGNDSCAAHRTCSGCTADERCGWCVDGGHCLAKSLDGDGDRCGTCSVWANTSCPLPCPGPACSGHGECESAGAAGSAPRCKCDPDWAAAPPADGADCAVYQPAAPDTCANAGPAAEVVITAGSLQWVDGWLYAVWRPPAAGAAHLAVGLGGPNAAAVPFLLRHGAAPVTGPTAHDVNDFEFWGENASGAAHTEPSCASALSAELRYQEVSPAHSDPDLWIAVKWPDRDRPVDVEVRAAELGCSKGYAGSLCNSPIKVLPDRLFAATAAGREAVQPAGVARGGWHYFQLEVPLGTVSLSVTSSGEGAADTQVYLRRAGLPRAGSAAPGQLSATVDHPRPGQWFAGVHLPPDAAAPAARFTLRVALGGCPLGSWGEGCLLQERQLAVGADNHFGASDWVLTGGRYRLVARVPAAQGAAALVARVLVAGAAEAVLNYATPASAAAADGAAASGIRGEAEDGELELSAARPQAGSWYLLISAASAGALTVRASSRYCDDCRAAAACQKTGAVVCSTAAPQQASPGCGSAAVVASALSGANVSALALPAWLPLYECVCPAAGCGDSPMALDTAANTSVEPRVGGEGGRSASTSGHHGPRFIGLIILIGVLCAAFAAGSAWRSWRLRKARAQGQYDIAPSAQAHHEEEGSPESPAEMHAGGAVV
eukprot:TRINITY_DN60036_c0_g1_i1.p1 TRINITY_DN60036_c0_g1~~TRINITY_DN60036_c0_g1_i1.p1  ORF type:complete len:1042 (+),score=204.09 TRINITY_DN60036_c0_g1_i1:69-3194(+)